MAKYGNLTYYTRINPDTLREYPVESRQRIFISYKKSDTFATDLCKKLKDIILEAVDCAVWYDSSLTPGENYDNEIEAAIRACDAVVLVVTEHILESEYVWKKEIPLAQKYQKRIIPVDVTKCSDSYKDIEARLGHIQLCVWKEAAEEDREEFKAYFAQTIRKYVINANIRLKIEQCFLAEKHKLSIRHLSLEDRYLIGLGYLKGIGTEENAAKAEKTLNSVIRYPESDGELEEIKEDAAEQLRTYYQNQIMYALREQDRQRLFEIQRKGQELGYDLLREMSSLCFSVIDKEFKKFIDQASSKQMGFRLQRLCVIYHFEQTRFSEKNYEEIAGDAGDFSYQMLRIILPIKDWKTRALYAEYFCKFCRNCVAILEGWDALVRSGTLEQTIEDERSKLIEPFRKYITVKEDYILCRAEPDPAKAKELLCRYVVHLLKACINDSIEACFVLGRLFSEGTLVEQNEDLAYNVMLYAVRMNPNRREEAQKIMEKRRQRQEILYPRRFQPIQSALEDLEKEAQQVIAGRNFYFVKPGKGTVYFMRDEEVLYDFFVWEGCGDFTTFQMTYDEAEDSIEILKYDMTHYDQDTNRTIVKIYDLDEEELRCEVTQLPRLKGRHFLPINDRRHRPF